MNKPLASMLKTAGLQIDSDSARRSRSKETKHMIDLEPVTVVDERQINEFADNPNSDAQKLIDQNTVPLAYQDCRRTVDFGSILNWPVEVSAWGNLR